MSSTLPFLSFKKCGLDLFAFIVICQRKHNRGSISNAGCSNGWEIVFKARRASPGSQPINIRPGPLQLFGGHVTRHTWRQPGIHSSKLVTKTQACRALFDNLYALRDKCLCICPAVFIGTPQLRSILGIPILTHLYIASRPRHTAALHPHPRLPVGIVRPAKRRARSTVPTDDVLRSTPRAVPELSRRGGPSHVL